MPVAAVNGTGPVPSGGGGGEMVRNLYACYVCVACGSGGWVCLMHCLSVVTGPDKHGPASAEKIFFPMPPFIKFPQALSCLCTHQPTLHLPITFTHVFECSLCWSGCPGPREKIFSPCPYHLLLPPSLPPSLPPPVHNHTSHRPVLHTHLY